MDVSSLAGTHRGQRGLATEQTRRGVSRACTMVVVLGGRNRRNERWREESWVVDHTPDRSSKGCHREAKALEHRRHRPNIQFEIAQKTAAAGPTGDAGRYRRWMSRAQVWLVTKPMNTGDGDKKNGGLTKSARMGETTENGTMRNCLDMSGDRRPIARGGQRHTGEIFLHTKSRICDNARQQERRTPVAGGRWAPCHAHALSPRNAQMHLGDPRANKKTTPHAGGTNHAAVKPLSASSCSSMFCMFPIYILRSAAYTRRTISTASTPAVEHASAAVASSKAPGPPDPPPSMPSPPPCARTPPPTVTVMATCGCASMGLMSTVAAVSLSGNVTRRLRWNSVAVSGIAVGAACHCQLSVCCQAGQQWRIASISAEHVCTRDGTARGIGKSSMSQV